MMTSTLVSMVVHIIILVSDDEAPPAERKQLLYIIIHMTAGVRRVNSTLKLWCHVDERKGPTRGKNEGRNQMLFYEIIYAFVQELRYAQTHVGLHIYLQVCDLSIYYHQA